MGSVVVHVEAGRAARAFSRGAVMLPAILREGMQRELPRPLVSVYRNVAPVRSGALREKIATHSGTSASRASIEVTSTVKSPEGFPYTGSTRFGRGPIVARKAQALAFRVGGVLIFRKSVKAYKPSHDWAEEGHPAAEGRVEDATESIGRDIERSLG